MSYDPHYDREWRARVRAKFIGPDARRCRCCREWWPVTDFGIVRSDGLRRQRCHACRRHCGPARRRRAVEITRAWRERLKSDVSVIRAARSGKMDRDEYSVLIGYPAQRPVSRLYSEGRGACVAEYRRNAT